MGCILNKLCKHIRIYIDNSKNYSANNPMNIVIETHSKSGEYLNVFSLEEVMLSMVHVREDTQYIIIFVNEVVFQKIDAPFHDNQVIKILNYKFVKYLDRYKAN
jgi:hypothetical protein